MQSSHVTCIGCSATQFSVVEGPSRRTVHTSSTSGVPAVRGFQVFPEQVEFGELKEGYTYACSVALKNTGIDSCRFKIRQPPASAGIKAIYTPGPVSVHTPLEPRACLVIGSMCILLLV